VYVDRPQLEWFERQLEAAAGRPVVVFTHAPPLGCGLKAVEVTSPYHPFRPTQYTSSPIKIQIQTLNLKPTALLIDDYLHRDQI
jgi:hypothetical protein